MQVNDEDANAIALYGLITGIEPGMQGKLSTCDCVNCKAATVMLRLFGDRMEMIAEGHNATKN